jgi:cysteine desulfurase
VAVLYLDHAASAPVDARVVAAMTECLSDVQSAGNAGAEHGFGRRARERIERARAEVASLIAAPVDSVVFTSGATESVNLALLGAVRAAASPRRHVITSRTEHRAGLGACAQLEREGVAVTYLTPARDGRISAKDVLAAVGPDTVLASLMLVNNETGVRQELGGLGAELQARGILLHVDAAQAAGRVPLDVGVLGADLVSLSAHKIHGPTGVGALYVRRRPRPALAPLAHGGGQEAGLRPGTPATHQIVGMGRAYALAAELFDAETARLFELTERLWRGIAPVGAIHRNGHASERAPHILNVSVEGVDGESLIAGLDSLAVSSGAACGAGSDQGSYVLRALGHDPLLARASLRLSLGRPSTVEEVDAAAGVIAGEIRRLRALAPRAQHG